MSEDQYKTKKIKLKNPCNPKYTKKNELEPCETRDTNKEILKCARKEYNDYKTKCEEKEHGDFVKMYFKDNIEQLTHETLIKGLFNFYKIEKSKNPDFTLPFNDFIKKFPRDNPVENTNYKRQHVFEAICRILLLLGYDRGEFGPNKTFFKSIEDKSNKIVDKTEILKSKVNESSAGGKADIYFQVNDSAEKTKIQEDNKKKWACELQQEEQFQTDGPINYIIQNKYYDSEKSSLDKYDLPQLFALQTQKEIKNARIILMVNNKQALDTKILRAKQDYSQFLYKIYGTDELDTWFQGMLFDMYKNYDTITKYINNFNPPKINFIQPRFHQLLFVESTLKYIEEPNNFKKFIWGAIPRSGKSFMIGGLIGERNKDKNGNDIVLILGAKTETLSQFRDMFKDYSDFKHYNIFVPGEDPIVREQHNRGIYLFSQELLKKHSQNDAEFNEKTINKYKSLFTKGNKIDLFFDEVHKGGSTDKSEGILYAFKNAGITIDLFVMVTATFAKPNIRYSGDNFIDTKPSKLIQWNYDDQQNMKQLDSETKKQLIINGFDDTLIKDVVTSLFTEYKTQYGTEYLSILKEEYSKHPELVIITPELLGTGKNTYRTDFKTVFNGNLKCDACKKDMPVEFYRDTRNIFANEGVVNDLLTFIEKSVYNYFHTQLAYPSASPHTELWFLPDKNLYSQPKECITDCGPVNIDENQDEDETSKTGLPNIEPLTRGLALKITRDFTDTLFDRYNVFIVHGTKVPHKDIYKLFDSSRVQMYDTKGSLSEQIKAFEIKTFQQGKSLIILTGAKLRLGISLPCADIAFNFDDIKSVDANYQTMFRVLTERNNPANTKKYGYYVDFNKERTISFLYEYDQFYGDRAKKKRADVVSLQSLLFTFNVNGLGLIKQKQKDFYSTLVEKLELNNESAFKYWSNGENAQRLLKKVMALASNLESLKQVAQLLKLKIGKKGKKTVKETLKKGEPHAKPPTEEPDSREDEEVESEEQFTEEYDISVLIDRISEQLPSIVALFAIFSQTEELTCRNLDECITQTIQHIKNHPDRRCSCDDLTSNIFDCFMNSPVYQYDYETLIKILEWIHTTFIDNVESRQAFNILNRIYTSNIEPMKRGEPPISNSTSDELLKLIQENLAVKTEEKDRFGEVFTPPVLINEMLDQLPGEVWSNADLKWLDPANGIGNFPMIAFTRLDEGLKDKIKDKKKRHEHIIKNMLYMVELNPKNVKIARRIFGKDANIFCGSFLEDGWQKAFGIEKFDVIMGNPPYNKDGVGKGGGVFWKDFVFASLKIINKNGYITFVHPIGWRKPVGERASAGDVWEEYKKGNLVYLNINDEKIKNFPVVDYYVWQNSKSHNNTKYFCKFQGKEYDGVKNLYGLRFIPNLLNDTVISILTKIIKKSDKNTFNIVYDQSFKPKKDDTTKEGLPHTFFYLPDKEQYTYVYKNYDEEPQYIKGKKIIMTYNSGKEKAKLYPAFFKTKVGSARNTMYQIVLSDQEGKSYVNFFSSTTINFILKITQYSEPPNYKNEYKILNMIEKPVVHIKTDNDVYDFFKLTKSEIEFIENVITKSRVTSKQIKPQSAPSSPEKPKKTTRRRAKSVSGGRKTRRRYN